MKDLLEATTARYARCVYWSLIIIVLGSTTASGTTITENLSSYLFTWYGDARMVVALLGSEFYRMMLKHFELYGFNIMGPAHGTGLLDLPPPWVLWRQYHAKGKIDEDIVLRAAFPFMLFIAAAMLFILVPHVKLIRAGYTTVEHLSCPGGDSKVDTKGNGSTPDPCFLKNPFDHGPKKNVKRIMGTFLGCLLPLPFRPDPYGQKSKEDST
eukprot:CAMPEP_0202033142 /NCGR_PEP_ID=MMETSP0905-20130828/65895_1 /ASSEMBLY_ACC=CAM_ASM_000554 /TAXON_ID=420261 /ORGANISM="Thalassiosira antarctica, Strain CCMP982" /LENGTH=210 /DNA_ID=CAMNT_0048597033 /DNA_START=526 /DNA_END=1155 /DNA_ORIENTATION=-